MIRRQRKQVSVQVEEPQNGDGLLVMKKILNGPDELDQKGRAFNHCFLDPGSGLGYHKHNGTMETMYILKGEGEMTVGEETQRVRAGDCIFIPSNQKHALYNKGSEEMHMMFVYSPSVIVDHWDQEKRGELR